jgi:hypothetical protein
MKVRDWLMELIVSSGAEPSSYYLRLGQLLGH